MSNKTTNVKVRVDEAIATKLAKLAAAGERSVGGEIRLAIREHIKRNGK